MLVRQLHGAHAAEDVREYRQAHEGGAGDDEHARRRTVLQKERHRASDRASDGARVEAHRHDEGAAGLFYGGKASGSFAAAFACVGVILAWVGSTMGVLFGTLKATGLLRVSQEIEDAGLDDSKHGGAMSEVVSEVTIKATEA